MVRHLETISLDERMTVKRPRQHIMEDESGRLLTTLIPSEWIVRAIPKDYGVDYEIEFVDQEIVSGNRIWIQMKSVEACKLQTQSYQLGDKFPELDTDGDGNLKVNYIPFSIAAKELHYALKCAFPLLLFVADLKQQDIYWLPIRDEIVGSLSHKNPNWSSQKSATLHLPTSSRITPTTSQRRQRMRRSRARWGIRWYEFRNRPEAPN